MKQVIQAEGVPFNSIIWSTLIAELQQDFQSIFRDIGFLFTYRLEKEVDVYQVNKLLTNFNKSILKVRGVVDQHLAETTTLWEQSKSHRKEDFSKLDNAWDSLRNRNKVIVSFEVRNSIIVINFVIIPFFFLFIFNYCSLPKEKEIRKVIQNVTNDLNQESDFFRWITVRI